jgi:hypothetical protein
MAIGTNSGVIKIFGQPGVEFYGQHTSITGNAVECVVQQLEWVPGTGRILSLTAANQLILWEPAGTLLVPIKSLALDGKLKKVIFFFVAIPAMLKKLSALHVDFFDLLFRAKRCGMDWYRRW